MRHTRTLRSSNARFAAEGHISPVSSAVKGKVTSPLTSGEAGGVTSEKLIRQIGVICGSGGPQDGGSFVLHQRFQHRVGVRLHLLCREPAEPRPHAPLPPLPLDAVVYGVQQK